LSERQPERATSAAPSSGTNAPLATGVNAAELLDLAPVGLVGIDALGIVTATNRKANEILQRDQPAILGAAFPDLFEASERERLSDFLNRCRSAAVGPEVFVAGENGRRRLVRVECAPAGSADATCASVLSLREAHADPEVWSEADGHLRAIFDESPIGMALVGADRFFHKVNRAFCESTGYTEAELTRLRFSDITHPDDAADDVALSERLFAGEISSFRVEKRYVSKSGEPLWINLTASLIRDAAGRPVYRLNMVEDISQRKRAEQALEHANQTLRTIIETSPLAIIALDLQGNITLWNAAAERTFGWKQEEVLNRPVPTAPEEEAERLRALIEGYRRGESVSGYQGRRRRKDGTVIDIQLWTAPLRDSSGRIVATLGLFVDATERNRLEEQLRQSQKLESLGTLAGGVAHDFNNLLTGILGNASLAVDVLPAENPARELLGDVILASERAADLTRQLLAYSGKGRFVSKPVSLSAVIRDIRTLILTSLPKKIKVELRLEDDLPRVLADPDQMQQVVMNLVINSAESIGLQSPGAIVITTGTSFIRPGQIQASTAGSALEPGSYACLEVRDTGCGMDAATISQIFDPFFTTKFLGRGLGLAAVSGIVRAHGGAINVASAPGQGSAFTVLLPAIQSAAQSDTASRPGRSLWGEGTVLVVDDEDVVRRTATLALQRFGYTVLTANNGSEAIEVFRRKATDISLVLLDLTMPVMGGEEALAGIRQVRADVPVVLSSGYTERDALRRFEGKAAISGFIQKPYSFRQIADKVKSVLQPLETDA
jgi:two-component system cell cycle sensor histidine kinase/response regulator CckA